MAARSIGSLTISFGLIAIPVKLYSATQSSSSISFNMLHKGCGSRLKQQYVCQKEGVVVERDDIVKGYEFAKDQYVQFAPEEIKALDEIGTHAIEIAEFVDIESIDPVFYDKSYYLAPDKGAAKPYALFAQALKETKRCAVARWAARGNSNLVMLRPLENGLVMQQLHFAGEVRSLAEIEVPNHEVKPAELTLAKQLIEQQFSANFDPTVYVDEVKSRVEAAIQRKVEGHEISIAEEPVAASGKVIDLMEALRASLEKTQAEKSSVAKLGARKEPKRAPAPEPQEEAAAAEPAAAAKPARKSRRSS